MDSASSAVGQVESTEELRVHRVDTVSKLQDLMPFVSHNQELLKYVVATWRDPDTLILRYGRSCAIVSILDHPFMGKIAIFAWGQNPDRFNTKAGLNLVERWSKDRGATKLISFVDENGPWNRIPAFTRLTGMTPYRMVFAKEL